MILQNMLIFSIHTVLKEFIVREVTMHSSMSYQCGNEYVNKQNTFTEH